jgi:hypothetical protein
MCEDDVALFVLTSVTRLKRSQNKPEKKHMQASWEILTFFPQIGSDMAACHELQLLCLCMFGQRAL